ncbi:MAG: hypothetical protein ACRDJC_13770 [Thermomicrobiales bacterium]
MRRRNAAGSPAPSSQARTGAGELGDEGRGRRDLVEAVEQEQDTLAGEPGVEGLAGMWSIGIGEADRLRDRRVQQLRLGDRGEPDQANPVGECLLQLPRGLDGDARFADTARSRERH